MSYQFDGSDTMGLQAAVAFVTAVPLWICAGFTQEDATEFANFPMLASQATSGASNNHRFSLGFSSTGAMTATSRTTSSATATSSTTIADSNWHVGLAEFISATSRRIEIDGASAGTNATSNTPTAGGINQFVLGIRPSLDGSSHEGKIAYAAIGSGTLSVGDRALLGAGGDPRGVTQGVLLELWDFTNLSTPLVGLIDETTLSAVGVPTLVSDRPDFAWLAGNQEEPATPAAASTPRSALARLYRSMLYGRR